MFQKINKKSWLAIFFPPYWVTQGRGHPRQAIIPPLSPPTGGYVVWQTKAFILSCSPFRIRRIINRELLYKGVHWNPDIYMATQSRIVVTYCFFSHLKSTSDGSSWPLSDLQSSVNLSVSSALSRHGIKYNCSSWRRVSKNHVRHSLRTFIREAICDLYLKKSHLGTKVIQLTAQNRAWTHTKICPTSKPFFFFCFLWVQEGLGYRFCFQKAPVVSFFFPIIPTKFLEYSSFKI